MAITAVAAAVGLAVVFTRPASEPAEAGEVILQPTSSTGPDPYTPSTAKSTSSLPSAAPDTPAGKKNALRSVTGSEPGLYGGSLNTASCDVEKQVRHLTADSSKNKAFASVLALRESAVAGYLRALTPVLLRSDTRVTNHGYRDGAPTDYQAVLQAGTAVLVDGHGEPKVRCACGNPLTPAVAHQGTPQQKGTPWSGFRPQDVVVVKRSATAIKEFVIFDTQDRSWVRRDSGDHGDADEKTTAPARHWPLPPKEPPAKEPPDEPGQDSEHRPDEDPKQEQEQEQEQPEYKPDDPGTKPDKPEQKPKEDKPKGEEPEHKPKEDKPEQKPKEDKPEHKPKEDKPEHKPKEDKPEHKPKEDKPEYKPDDPGTKPDKPEQKPEQEKPEHKPKEDKHEEKPNEEKPNEEKPNEEKPNQEGPGEKPGEEQQQPGPDDGNQQQPGPDDGNQQQQQPGPDDGDQQQQQPGPDDGNQQQPGPDDGNQQQQQPGPDDGDQQQQQPGPDDGNQQQQQPGPDDGNQS
ncbi:DUF6777 domain-containing protein [Streptomyces sp. NPDC047706]|uniref:DUF6777 domain-containing protein n=1 Tax=Streptomyces sp. NPDC047706 TaxID=3365486 RepID=UPI00371B256D